MNLIVDFNPIAISLFGINIHWYGLMYLISFIAAYKYGCHIQKNNSQYFPYFDLESLFCYCILGVIIGGRMGYVFFYKPNYFLQNPLDIFKVWQGGMSFHGGLIGVSIATFIFGKLNKLRILQLADLLSCVAPIGLFFGRIGNFINGELFGRVVSSNHVLNFIFPLSGSTLPRHPSQIYEAVLEGLFLFCIMLLFRRKYVSKMRSGFLLFIFLLSYSLIRFFIEFVREPDSFITPGLFTQGQILSLVMAIFSLIYGYLTFLYSKESR